jgi:hypothetical protein
MADRREGALRLLIVIPHHFGPGPANLPNLSNRPRARRQRAQGLTAVIGSLHQDFGRDVFRLDHGERRMVPARQGDGDTVDFIACTHGAHHLLGDLGPLRNSFRQQEVSGDPQHLGFEGHGLLHDQKQKRSYQKYR